ncbi:MAG: hypothetical protein WA749_08395 [Gelidibacter sp.]
MKTFLNIVVATLVLVGISCKETTKENVETIDMENQNKATLSKIEEQCFWYAKNKDTIKLMLKENKTLVTGKMVINLYEKDGSHGSFEGILKGDTLFADYDFESEGITSKRELIFLKKGNTLLQGYGDVEEEGQHTTVFKKGAKITFDEKFPLTAVDCKNINL